jgi:hypothetical protein
MHTLHVPMVYISVFLYNLVHTCIYLCLYQVVATAPKRCPDFSSESIYAGILYLENHLISSLNDYCKRKETPQNGKLESSRLEWLLFRPSRISGPHLHSNLKLMSLHSNLKLTPLPGLYLTISTEQVLILTSKLVHHLYHVVDACMMQPEPAVLPPRISMSQGSGLSQTGHHAQHHPGACFA